MNRKSGFTLVEILIILAIVGLLVAMVLPNYFKTRSQARSSICVNNLRLITQAVAQYQIDEGIPDGVDVELYGSRIMNATDPAAYIQRELTCPETNHKYPNIKTGEIAACPDVASYPDHVYKKEGQ